MTYRKKLIEVVLPHEAINIASAREKSIRRGHPYTLRLWWARRPVPRLWRHPDEDQVHSLITLKSWFLTTVAGGDYGSCPPLENIAQILPLDQNTTFLGENG